MNIAAAPVNMGANRPYSPPDRRPAASYFRGGMRPLRTGRNYRPRLFDCWALFKVLGF